jgi:N-glycosylase/DNA lyase
MARNRQSKTESLPEKVGLLGLPAFDHGTDWLPLDSRFCLRERVVHELLEGGQTFAWDRLSGPEPIWQGVIGSSLLQVRCGTDGLIRLRTRTEAESAAARTGLAGLLRLDEDADHWQQGLPIAQDEYLRRCMEAFPGLRILRQPIEEVLLSFLCSSNKHVTQIKRMIRRISLRWGEPLAAGYARAPAWEVLAEADDEELRACGTGYRSKYILGTARRISEDPGFLERVRPSHWSSEVAPDGIARSGEQSGRLYLVVWGGAL